MLRLSQVKMNINHTEEQLKNKVCKLLHVKAEELLKLQIIKKSIDARKKPEIYFLYTVDVEVSCEKRILKHLPKDCIIPNDVSYQMIRNSSLSKEETIVVVGAGPAGLFCTYLLCVNGYKPILVERGAPVEERQADVSKFWETGILDTASNVQFGEGGAGTFSDGKLNTLIKDKTGRNKFVLETFVKFGAPTSILYDAKPHIGTDILMTVIKNMRLFLIEHGAVIRFHSKVTNLCIEKNQLVGVAINETEQIATRHLVLCIGHSARDTFEMLNKQQVHMEAKSFAVGFRVEHPREFINESQYGMKHSEFLPTANYKLTAQTSLGRGVYTFCMCPGGYVVNASSEENRLAINGMSYSDRNGDNSNSAVIITVTPDDFDKKGPLAGVEFQRKIEERAYEIGHGKVPVETFGDFEIAVGSLNEAETVGVTQNTVDTTTIKETTFINNAAVTKTLKREYSTFEPTIKGDWTYGAVHDILPMQMNQAFVEGMHVFGKKLHGYDDPTSYVSGIESRTSSPIRISRDENCVSVNISGLYPCGEGAGYAGGIMSAAMDGLLVAEKLLHI